MTLSDVTPRRYDVVPSGAVPRTARCSPSVPGKLHVTDGSLSAPARPGTPAKVSAASGTSDAVAAGGGADDDDGLASLGLSSLHAAATTRHATASRVSTRMPRSSRSQATIAP